MSNWHRIKQNKSSLGHKKNKEREKERKRKKEKENRENLRKNSINNNTKLTFLYFFSPFFPKELSQKQARKKILFFLLLAVITIAISLYMAVRLSLK